MQQRVEQKMALMGRADYLHLLATFERDYPKHLAELKVSQTLRSGLHSLKGMCYAVGFEEIGTKIADIEHMLHNGASVTVRIHLQGLEPKIKHALRETRLYLAQGSR